MLEHGADLDGELAFAVATAPQARTNTLRRVGFHLGQTVQRAAVRTYRSVRPNDAFQILKSGGFVVKIGAGQDRH